MRVSAGVMVEIFQIEAGQRCTGAAEGILKQ